MSQLLSLPVLSSQELLESSTLTFDDVEREMEAFEAAERQRLGLDEKPVRHWVDPNPQQFLRSERESTTILTGGLTVAQDIFAKAAFESLGYHIEVLPVPDTAALHLGKEFGNRGQCNPTYFTVGNLVKRLVELRQTMPAEEIVRKYVFLTAGACGPCRFGTYATEYRKALRDAGFDGFRVMLFQQQGGLKQATGEETGLAFSPKFFMQLLKGLLAGDVLNVMGYRIRPYEVHKGETDATIERCKGIICDALRGKKSILRALLRCRSEFRKIAVDRLQAKPKVMIIGEFWAMTTEGDGNYHLQRFLESEGAEVDIQIMSAWLLYMIWQNRHDTLRRIDLKGEDGTRKGLAGKDARKSLRRLWLAEKALRSTFRVFAWAIGLEDYHLPDMDKIASLANEHYHVELRGGEGHMEVGKLIEAVQKKKAHMVLSVKPFGCMPSSGVSDGVQQIVLSKFPDAVFCPVETTGDGEVNFQSRVLMYLFKARRQAREEFDSALRERSLTVESARRRLNRKHRRTTWYPPHTGAGTGANLLAALR